MEKKTRLTSKLNEFNATRLFQELSLEETIILWMFAHKKFGDKFVIDGDYNARDAWDKSATRVEDALFGSEYFDYRDDPPNQTLFWLREVGKFRAQGLLAALHQKLVGLVDEIFDDL